MFVVSDTDESGEPSRFWFPPSTAGEVAKDATTGSKPACATSPGITSQNQSTAPVKTFANSTPLFSLSTGTKEKMGSFMSSGQQQFSFGGLSLPTEDNGVELESSHTEHSDPQGNSPPPKQSSAASASEGGNFVSETKESDLAVSSSNRGQLLQPASPLSADTGCTFNLQKFDSLLTSVRDPQSSDEYDDEDDEEDEEDEGDEDYDKEALSEEDGDELNEKEKSKLSFSFSPASFTLQPPTFSFTGTKSDNASSSSSTEPSFGLLPTNLGVERICTHTHTHTKAESN